MPPSTKCRAPILPTRVIQKIKESHRLVSKVIRLVCTRSVREILNQTCDSSKTASHSLGYLENRWMKEGVDFVGEREHGPGHARNEKKQTRNQSTYEMEVEQNQAYTSVTVHPFRPSRLNNVITTIKDGAKRMNARQDCSSFLQRMLFGMVAGELPATRNVWSAAAFASEK